jgi:hypothetical protein
MNYFAHGIRYLDRPWFLAGTAAPDWLSVADRKVRLREKFLASQRDHPDRRVRELTAGVLRHLHDDSWFHNTSAFHEVTAQVADCFRRQRDDDERIRPGFLGHIFTEMLLDRLLIEDDPQRLDEYYRVLSRLEGRHVEHVVNSVAPRPTDRLAYFVDLFVEIRFLDDYRDNRRLLERLNQVLRRVKLVPLSDAYLEAVEESWSVIRRRGRELLPAERFPATHTLGRTTT